MKYLGYFISSNSYYATKVFSFSYASKFLRILLSVFMSSDYASDTLSFSHSKSSLRAFEAALSSRKRSSRLSLALQTWLQLSSNVCYSDSKFLAYSINSFIWLSVNRPLTILSFNKSSFFLSEVS